MLAWVLVFRVTYSIVDFTHFEIDLGGVAVDIYIERAGFIILVFFICIFRKIICSLFFYWFCTLLWFLLEYLYSLRFLAALTNKIQAHAMFALILTSVMHIDLCDKAIW